MSYDPQRRANFALGLKSARKAAGLSAKQASLLLASRGISCRPGTLLAWERGNGNTSREPFASDLAVIAQVYGCTIHQLFWPELQGDRVGRAASREGEPALGKMTNDE